MTRRQKKGQPLFLRTAGLDFRFSEGTHPTPIVIPASVLRLTQKNRTKSVSRLRIRAPDRSPAPLFHSRHPAPRRQDPPILAGRHTSDSRFPALLDEVEGRHAQANDSKAQGEQGEGRQQLADKVKLKRDDTPQKPPDPLAKAIFGVHGFWISPYPASSWRRLDSLLFRLDASHLTFGTKHRTCPIRQGKREEIYSTKVTKWQANWASSTPMS